MSGVFNSLKLNCLPNAVLKPGIALVPPIASCLLVVSENCSDFCNLPNKSNVLFVNYLLPTLNSAADLLASTHA